MRDLREVDVDILTLGQYLRPSDGHIPLDRYVTPDEFRELYEIGMALGFRHVESGPLVRSSYHAWEQVQAAGVLSWTRQSAALPATPLDTHVGTAHEPAQPTRVTAHGQERTAIEPATKRNAPAPTPASCNRELLHSMLLQRRFEERMRRGVRARQDRRLLPPLHRTGSGEHRHDLACSAPTTTSSRPTATTARRSRAA